MPHHFTRTFRVRWAEVNAIGQVDPSEYCRYVVETAWDYGAANGLGMAESGDLGLFWVIRETEIHLFRPLYPNDVFEVTIWLIDWRRVRGTRCFEILLKDGGQLVAQGTQEIVAIDSQTLRPAAPPEPILDNFRAAHPRVLPHRKFPDLQISRKAAFVLPRPVEWGNMDSQEQLNNADYVVFAEDAAVEALAGLGWSPAQCKAQGLAVLNQRVHIRYHSPASWGETLDVVTALLELRPTGGVWYIDFQRRSDGASIAQCVIDWSLVNRTGGTEEILPEGLFHGLTERFAIPADNAGQQSPG